MYGYINSQWFDLSMRLVEPMISINKLMISTAERMVNKQIDLAVDHLYFWRQQMKMVTEMGGQAVSLAEQGKIVASYGNKMMERRDEFLEIASDAKQTLKRIATDSTNSATSKVKQKSKVIAKAA